MQPRTRRVLYNLGILWGIDLVILLIAYSVRNPASVLDDRTNPDAVFLLIIASLIAAIGTPLVIRLSGTEPQYTSPTQGSPYKAECSKCRRIAGELKACKSCGKRFCLTCLGKTIVAQHMPGAEGEVKCLSCGMPFF